MYCLCPTEEFMPFNNKQKSMDGLILDPETIYMSEKAQHMNCRAGSEP